MTLKILQHFVTTFSSVYVMLYAVSIIGYDLDFSYGVTVWEILTRKIPYQGMKQAVIINYIFEGNRTLPIPEQSPDAIRDILKGQSISEIILKDNQATYM